MVLLAQAGVWMSVNSLFSSYLSLLALILIPFNTWFWAILVSGAPVSISRLIGMKLRKIRVAAIVDAYITGKKAGLNIDIAIPRNPIYGEGRCRKGC